MKLLHTSDWHLGHTLRDRSRAFEHAQFLGWLLDVVEEEQIDALLVAGDIFETANPSADAQETWFRFLADTRARFPSLEVVIIGGNHDSPARLNAANPILRALDLRVVGGLPNVDGRLQPDQVVLPVQGRRGDRAWIVAVPFLRASDLPSGVSPDAFAEGVSMVYRGAVEHASRVRQAHEPIIAMGHLHVQGTRLSEESERKITGGSQQALPPSVIPQGVAYAALGHLHLAQEVGAGHLRYSGSPIPLSMAEASYRHQVCVVDLDGASVREVRERLVPRSVEMRRIPLQGSAPIDEVLRELATLPSKVSSPEQRHPFVEVVVSTSGPEPGLVDRIGQVVADRAAFLVKVTREAAPRADLAAPAPVVRRTFTPDELFERRWIREHATPPPAEFVSAFHELVDAANQETP